MNLIPFILLAMMVAAPPALAADPPPSQTAQPARPPADRTTPADHATGATTEDGLRRLLDPLEARYESACARMSEAQWRLILKKPDADPNALEAAVSSARKELADVYADPALDATLPYWTRRLTVTKDPSLSRRVFLWNKTREIAGVELDPNIFTLTQSLASRLRGQRFSWRGAQATRAQLDDVLASSPDREERRKAWLAEAAFADAVKPEVKKLIRSRAVKARGTTQKYFHHLAYGGRELDAYWAYGLMEQLAGRTRISYMALRDALMKTLGVTTLEPWDVDYALTKRTAERGIDKAIAAAFPPGGAPAAARKLALALGFDPKTLPADVPQASLGSDLAVSLALRIPGDARVAADASAGGAGPRFYEAVFREYGRALQGSLGGQSAPMLKGYQCVDGTRNETYAEGLAEAFAAFLRDPLFLEKQLGMDRKAIAPFLDDESDRALVRLRRLLLDMGIEFAFYVNPDADLDERYRTLMEKSLGVQATEKTPIAWTARVAFVTRPAGDLDQILALSIAPEVLDRLRESFGDARFSGKAAPWLIEHCYANGELVELQMRLSDSIHGGLDFDKYLASLAERPKNP